STRPRTRPTPWQARRPPHDSPIAARWRAYGRERTDAGRLRCASRELKPYSTCGRMHTDVPRRDRGLKGEAMSDRGDEHYTVISADCHAGGSHEMYREYLDPAYIAEFDAWREKYKNPFRDLQDGGRVRNWDDDRRNGDLESDG